VIDALLAGRWQPRRGPAESDDVPADDLSLRFFTRREVEKLLDRGGFKISSIVAAPSPHLEAWRAVGMPGEVAIGSARIGDLDREDAEDFYVERYNVEAAREERPSYALTSIVIVTHNQLAYTRGCLESIRFVTDEPYELIVVDNGSTDGTPQCLGSMGDVRLIANADNRGFPAAANQGIRAARGRQVLLLNNDVLATTGWLRRMLDALHFGDAVVPTLTRSASEEEPGDGLANASGWCEAAAHPVGLVGPCSNYISGPQQVVAGYDDLGALDGFAWEWAKGHAGRREEVDRLVGFCLLISRDVVERVGLLDERFGIGNFEDDDYCRRAAAAGFRMVIARDAFVHHFGHRSFAAAGVDLAALLERNQRLYDEKWAAEGRGDAGKVTETSATPTVPYSLSPVTRTLSLCMIVRQNARTIRACLESIKPWVGGQVHFLKDSGGLGLFFPRPTARTERRFKAEPHCGGLNPCLAAVRLTAQPAPADGFD
ncbi:MAG: glycosyltransferase family 2 protein, partial [Stellaceae bacterium]